MLGDCGDPKCPGWAVFNSAEVQRCDECAVFADDDEALRAAAGHLSLKLNRRLDRGPVGSLSFDDAIVAISVLTLFQKPEPRRCAVCEACSAEPCRAARESRGAHHGSEVEDDREHP